MSVSTYTISPWFDQVADYCENERTRHSESIEKILLATHKFPNRKNLEYLKSLVENLKHTKVRNALLESINDILDGEDVKKYYRYRFHRYPAKTPGWTQVSATGELFNTLQQAITYAD